MRFLVNSGFFRNYIKINFLSDPSLTVETIPLQGFVPFVKRMPSFVQDSQHLMQNLDNTFVPPDCVLFSCDFESLYTSLDQETTLNKISDFMASKLDPNFINAYGFRTILFLVLSNN
jgi:hypothetical protein